MQVALEEAVMNVAMHAFARAGGPGDGPVRPRAGLRGSGVEDDGQPFDPAVAPRGSGLKACAKPSRAGSA